MSSSVIIHVYILVCLVLPDSKLQKTFTRKEEHLFLVTNAAFTVPDGHCMAETSRGLVMERTKQQAQECVLRVTKRL